jgi:signal transduction histidine kinase/ligand-binding sensor domain-containing protein
MFRGRRTSCAVLFALALCRIVCVDCSRAAAQDLSYLADQSWSTAEGLPQNSVHSIAQTSDGYLWAATEAGLVRFDGAQFQVYDHNNEAAFLSDDLCCLVADGSDILWIGTADGLVRMQHGKFTRFGPAEGLPSAQILRLDQRPEGTLAVTTSVGSVLWPPPSSTSPVKSTASQSTGWTHTDQRVDLKRGATHRTWQVDRELPAGRVTSLLIDGQGLAWVGMTSGLVVIDPQTGKVSQIPAFAGTSILSLFQDAEGNHWIGTESSGLHVLRQLTFRGIPALAEKAVTSVVQTTDGTIWVGTRDAGLYRVRDGSVDQPVPPRALTSAVILGLQPSVNGGLWVGTPDGLNFVATNNAVSQITSASGLPDDYIRSLAATPDGSIWAGTRHGLVHLGNSHRETLTGADGLGGDLIGAMLLDSVKSRPRLWAATSGGLSQIEENGHITNFASKEGLASPIVTALAEDRAGRLWVATADGTFQILNGRHFDPIFHLPQNTPRNAVVEAIRIDSAQSLWSRLDRGILRIAAPQLKYCLAHTPCVLQDDQITRYGPADGLRNDEVVPRATPLPWLSPTGEIWFPTRFGVAIAHAGSTTTVPAAPPVVIQRFLLDDAAIEIAQAAPQLPFGHQRLTMEYAALSFVVPSEIHYRYRLDGFDRDWIQAGNRRSATYTNLAPGDYTFRVQARANGGYWTHKEADLHFRITPPFYRRWWFLVLAAVAILLVLLGLYYARLRRLRNRFDAVLAERNRMAREIHDTLTQDFISTSLQLDIIAQQLNQGHLEKAIEQVRRARQMVTEGLTEARQSIWELRANRSEDMLPTRLARLVQREAFARTNPHLQVRGAYRAVGHRIEREILRLANEALVNVREHAGSQHTAIDLFYSSEALMLTIADNGIGFDMDKALHKEGHYGLVGMKERASIIDGALTIVSDPGRGTTVTLRVPLT